MSWVKRNLYFVIGCTIAVLLLGMAGWYLYSKWDLDNKKWSDLNEAYDNLTKLNQQKPHPGGNNIQLAKDQQQELRAFSQKTRTHFQRISPIPDIPKITDHDFSEALSRAIDRLRRDATHASVTLPDRCDFSFKAEANKLVFAPGSLGPLSVQLGEVKVICDVLVQAKINSLDYLRRERVSADDAAGEQSDYLNITSVTNELGVLTPYELTFRCFSPELAAVLAGFASSPYGLIVKTLNVEPGSAMTDMNTMSLTGGGTPPPPSQPVVPQYAPPPQAPPRYPGGIGEGEGGIRRPPYPTPQPVYTPPPVAVGNALTPVRGGLQTVLDERQLKVTMVVEVVKLAPVAAK
jgi:hypothetical protein